MTRKERRQLRMNAERGKGREKAKLIDEEMGLLIKEEPFQDAIDCVNKQEVNDKRGKNDARTDNRNDNTNFEL